MPTHPAPPRFKRSLPYLMQRAQDQQLNLIVRPRMPEHSPVSLLQLDDLSPLNLERVRNLAFTEPARILAKSDSRSTTPCWTSSVG